MPVLLALLVAGAMRSPSDLKAGAADLSAATTELVVGGGSAAGWGAMKVEELTASTGTKLVFKWGNGHNVVMTSADAWSACTLGDEDSTCLATDAGSANGDCESGPELTKGADNKYTYEAVASKAGEYYFICAVPGHCSSQKVKVTVTDAAPPATPPPPTPPPDIKFQLQPDDPDSDTDQTANLYHEEPYTVTYASSSGHVLSQYDYLFFIPAASSSCPASGPSSNGGFLNADNQITVQLSATQSPYALCVREGLDGSAPVTLHAHITAVVSFRSPSLPPSLPPSPPPPSPSPPPPPTSPPPTSPPSAPPTDFNLSVIIGILALCTFVVFLICGITYVRRRKRAATRAPAAAGALDACNGPPPNKLKEFVHFTNWQRDCDNREQGTPTTARYTDEKMRAIGGSSRRTTLSMARS